MGQAYNVILGQSMTFTRSNIESLKGWEAMLESSEMISLMKGIKGIIFQNNDTDYFYTGMCSDLRGFLNLHQGGVTVTEYHERWTANKDMEEEFGYNIGESGQATNRKCEADGINTSDDDYEKNRAGASDVAQ